MIFFVSVTKMFFGFEVENFEQNLRSNMFLPFSSVTISPTTKTYKGKVVQLDEIYKMVSVTFRSLI